MMLVARILLVAGVVVALAACGTPTARTAIQRFDDAVALISRSTGTVADDVAVRFRSSLIGATDDVLAESAERVAARTTWIDDAVQAARPVGGAIDDPSLRTMTGASCETLQYRLDYGVWPTEGEFVAIVAGNLAQQGLDTGWSNVEAAASDVVEHLEELLAGSPDYQRLFLDIVCLSV